MLEGPDKSGKSTQALMLVEALRRRNLKVIHTREPGGSPVSESIRQVLLAPTHKVAPLTELFLYEASRAQHVEETIRPALDAGHIVICERYTLSTDVYQGLGRHLGVKTTRALSFYATGGLKPDLTVVIDIPDSEFTKRDKERVLDRLERESALFRRRVRLGYRKLARQSSKTEIFDGTNDPAKLNSIILSLVEKKLK